MLINNTDVVFRRWTKSVDIFQKKLVIIPVCTGTHWYLILAIRPGDILVGFYVYLQHKLPLYFFSQGNGFLGAPFFILLDSLPDPNGRSEAIQNIRGYLSQEWYEKIAKGGSAELTEFTEKEMKLIEPVKPEQKNGYDCGIYLLTYIEKVFDNMHEFVGSKGMTPKNLSSWFTMDEISFKRKEIKATIFELSKVQYPANLDAYMGKSRESSLSDDEVRGQESLLNAGEEKVDESCSGGVDGTRSKEKSPVDSDLKYQEWLQGLANAEFQFRRGCEEFEEEDDEFKPEFKNDEENKDKSDDNDSIYNDADESDLSDQHMEDSIATVKSKVRLTFVQSPEEIRDHKDPWKNRLRVKSKYRK